MMSLSLEIEYLLGVAFMAVGPNSDTSDWPPRPDRIFSALVAAWAARGRREDERSALEWLERQKIPRIFASSAVARTAPQVFVPPNDPKTKTKGDPTVAPSLRRRQPRRFPATRPFDPLVKLVWEADEIPEAKVHALNVMARDTAYIGHSASLTRCRFMLHREIGSAHVEQSPKRRIYPGRLAELEASYQAGRRPRLGDWVAPSAPRHDEFAKSDFGTEWLILDHINGEMPDIRAAALVSKAVRDAIMSGYARIELDERIPEVISGHRPDGTPTRDSHLAIMPLAFAGFPYADGRVLGFALVPPRFTEILGDEDFRRAIAAIAPLKDGQRMLEIRGERFRLDLSPVLDANRRSLDPAFYTKPARTFATVTPIVLDRHLKQSGIQRDEEIVSLIKAACRNIGLPEPELVVPDKHSAVEGAPSTRPSGQAPSWTRWRLPTSLVSRALTHAVLRFSSTVEGPVILGAGRFVGLGLCRVIEEEMAASLDHQEAAR